jgi:hypothetical protein
MRGVGEVAKIPMALLLTAVFVGANFVAVIFLTWMPSYLNRAFGMSLSMAGLNATFWLQAASVAGVLCGGWLADRWARRMRGGWEKMCRGQRGDPHEMRQVPLWLSKDIDRWREVHQGRDPGPGGVPKAEEAVARVSGAVRVVGLQTL